MPYYLCPVIGTGAMDDPHRPYISNYPVNWVVVMDSDQPTKRGSLVYCSNPTKEVDADPEMHRIDPDDDLGKRLRRVDFIRLKSRLSRHGLTRKINDDADESTFNVRQLINLVGKEFFEEFDLKNFFVL